MDPKFKVGDIVHPRFNITQLYAAMRKHENGTVVYIRQLENGDYDYTVRADGGFVFTAHEVCWVGGKANV